MCGHLAAILRLVEGMAHQHRVAAGCTCSLCAGIREIRRLVPLVEAEHASLARRIGELVTEVQRLTPEQR